MALPATADSRNKREIVLNPGPVKAPKPEIGFVLSRPEGTQGVLELAFHAKNPNHYLNTRESIVAQIESDEPVEVKPYILTKSNWPEGSDRVRLKYRGARKGGKYEIYGEAAFTVCHRKTNVCRKKKAGFRYTLTP